MNRTTMLHANWQRSRRCYLHRSGGFTLIEILIVVAIAGILATVAYPSYLEHVYKSRRAQAKADLTELAQFMERNYTVAARYDKSSAGADGTFGTSDDVAISLPFANSPRTGTAMYTLSLTSDANTFTLTATRAGAQSSDKCGNLTLNQAGTKGIVSGSSGRTAAQCW